MVTRKYFSEIYRLFGHKLSNRFASPGLGIPRQKTDKWKLKYCDIKLYNSQQFHA